MNFEESNKKGKTYLIRHTKPDIDEGICYGQSDLKLANSYPSELDQVKQFINIEKEGIVYSSPLFRCKTLAQDLSLQSNTISYDKRLKELNFGNWELQAWKEIPQDEFKLWSADFVNNTPTDGESYKNMYSRVISFFKEIDFSQNNYIVSHSGTLRCILSYLLEIPLNKSFEIKLDYGSVISVQHIFENHHQIEFLKT